MQETIIDLRQFENVLNPIYILYLYDKKRYLILYGGAGAGKSHFACQKILYRTMAEKGHRFLIIRKVARTLRQSVFQLFLDYISKWGLTQEFKINRTDMTITFEGNGNMILCAGVDDPEKLKSIEGITGIWVEEANELYLEDFQELDRRLRGIFHVYVQIILTYNPILKTNWTYPRFFFGLTKAELEDITKLRTTYKDNIYIKEDLAYKKLLESYTGNMRTVFTLGEYGMLENAIYTNWEMIDDDKFPDEEAICGLDFGFINPNCLIKTVVDIDKKEIYVDELIYKRYQTIPELIGEMKLLNLQDIKIVADSEAPDKIEEIRRAGFSYAEGARKEKGSVKAGIDYIQQFKIYITRRSVNVKKEIESYQRRKDKEGNILEEPEKGLDHAMDCIRYVLYTVYYIIGQPNFFAF